MYPLCHHSAIIAFWFNQLFDLIAVKKVRLIVALRGNLIRNMTDDFCESWLSKGQIISE